MIPAEAVEAAADAIRDLWDSGTPVTPEDEARAALEAAAPYMLREAQEVAWAKGATSAGMNLMTLQAAGINPNPYQRESRG